MLHHARKYNSLLIHYQTCSARQARIVKTGCLDTVGLAGNLYSVSKLVAGILPEWLLEYLRLVAGILPECLLEYTGLSAGLPLERLLDYIWLFT